MFQILKHLIRADFRVAYRSPLISLAIDCANGFLVLSVYSLTSKAISQGFDGAATNFGGDYFRFVLTGELILFLPFSLLESFGRCLRPLIQERTLEQGLTTPISPLELLLAHAAALMPRRLVSLAIQIALAVFCFGYRIPLRSLTTVLAGQLAILPLCIAIGLLVSACFLRFGRGAGILGQVGFAIAILSGVYFPIQMLPLPLQWVSRFGSPFTGLVEAGRQAAAGDPVSLFPLTVYLFVGSVAFGLAHWVWTRSVIRFRRRGCQLRLIY